MMNDNIDNIIYQQENVKSSSVTITYISYTKIGEIKAVVCSDEEKIIITSPELNIDLYLKNISYLEAKSILDKMQYKTFLVALHNLCLSSQNKGIKNIYKSLQNLLTLNVPKNPLTDYMIINYH